MYIICVEDVFFAENKRDNKDRTNFMYPNDKWSNEFVSTIAKNTRKIHFAPVLNCQTGDFHVMTFSLSVHDLFS